MQLTTTKFCVLILFACLGCDQVSHKENLRPNIVFIIADDLIGKILDAIQNSPYKDNTYVVLTSDHGYHMGEKDLLFKYTLWDKGRKVPFIVYGPDVLAGKLEDQPVSLIDLFPIFLDWTGVDPSDSLKLDGNPIQPLLKPAPQRKWEGDDFALLALASDTQLEDGVPGEPEDHHNGIVTKRYRYSRANNGEEELYDHKNDSHEWGNLAKEQGYSEQLLSMRNELRDRVFEGSVTN